MKTKLFAAIICLLGSGLLAQVPQKMSYQAIVRDASGALVTNATVRMRITILEGSLPGTVVYTEIKTPVTNANGLVTTEIGGGAGFDAIDWGSNLHFIKTETDPSGGTNYSIATTSQLLSVPYALHAKTVETGDNWGTETVATDATLSGQGTVAQPLKIADKAVTSSKIADRTITTLNLASGSVTSAEIVDRTIVTADLADNSVTSSKIADGGVTRTDLADNCITTEKLINGSVTAMKLADMGGVAGSVLKWSGSIWYPGTDMAGITLPYYEKCSTNVGFVVHNEDGIAIEGLASSSANTGSGTGLMGESRKDNGTGVYGLASATTGTTYALRAESKSSNGFGLHALASHASGSNYGVMAESRSTHGTGVSGSNYSTTGTTYGVRGTVSSSSGWSGFFSGGRFYVNGRVGLATTEPKGGLHLKGSGYPESFMFLESSLGQDAGFRLYEGITEKWHIFNNAAAGGLTINNHAYTVAIFAKQTNAFIGLGTTAPTQKLHVVGNAYKTEGGTSWATSSDLRLKTVLGGYEKGLDEIAALKTVRFVYNANNPRQLAAGVEQVGFVAQEVQKVFPEAVTKAEDGYLDFNIHAINIALVNAVKELKAENDRLKQQNASLTAEQSALKASLERQQQETIAERDALKTRLEKIESLLQTNASAEGN